MNWKRKGLQQRMEHQQKLTFLEKVWALACLPFLWAVHEHPKATGRCIWAAAVLAAIWGE